MEIKICPWSDPTFEASMIDVSIERDIFRNIMGTKLAHEPSEEDFFRYIQSKGVYLEPLKVVGSNEREWSFNCYASNDKFFRIQYYYTWD